MTHSPVHPGVHGPQQRPRSEPSQTRGTHKGTKGHRLSPRPSPVTELGDSSLPAGHKPPPDLASHRSPPPPVVNKLMVTGRLCLDAGCIRRCCWLLRGGCSPDPTAPTGVGVLTRPNTSSLSGHSTGVPGHPCPEPCVPLPRLPPTAFHHA